MKKDRRMSIRNFMPWLICIYDYSRCIRIHRSTSITAFVVATYSDSDCADCTGTGTATTDMTIAYDYGINVL